MFEFHMVPAKRTLAVALCALTPIAGCKGSSGQESATIASGGLGSSGEQGAGNAGGSGNGGTLAPSGGHAGFAGDAGHSASGGAAGQPGTGGAAPHPSYTGSACIPRADVPRNCTDACLDQGQVCDMNCDFAPSLPGRAGYYPDRASCEAGVPSFSESAQCDANFSGPVLNALNWSVVRCCCVSADFNAATLEERNAICETACQAAPDQSMRPVDCGPAPDCQEDCLDVTRGVELACAECLIGDPRIHHEAHCGEWECQCPSISFSYLSTFRCSEECAAARARAGID